MENLKKVMIRVAPSDWKLFKEIAKMEGSNASVEVRRFIKSYLAKQTDKINKLIKEKVMK